MGAKRHMTDEVGEIIVNIMKRWPADEKFGWEPLREAIRDFYRWSSINDVWSKVQLAKYEAIYEAYTNLKNEIRSGKKPRGKHDELPPDLKLAYEEIDSLQIEVDQLKQQKNDLLERFERWLYNARAFGVSTTDLDKPLTFEPPPG